MAARKTKKDKMKGISAIVVYSVLKPGKLSLRGENESLKDALTDAGFKDGNKVYIILADDFESEMSDEIKEVLEADEPSEDFVNWYIENLDTFLSDNGHLTGWQCYQKGVRDGQREKMPVEQFEEGMFYCMNIGCKELVNGCKFCPKCGAPLDWSE